MKRTRSATEGDMQDPQDIYNILVGARPGSQPALPVLAAAPDIQMTDFIRPSSAAPVMQPNGEDGPSPAKRARTEPPHLEQIQTVQRTGTQPQIPVSVQSQSQPQTIPMIPSTRPASRAQTSTPQPTNGINHHDGVLQMLSRQQPDSVTESGDHTNRFASKPAGPRSMDITAPLKDFRRASILTAICQQDDPNTVLDLLREIPLDNHVGVDVVLDDLGHTALHVAASLGRLRTVAALIDSGADIHRGNYNGETPLIRACLALENFNQQSFASLVETLQSSIHTLDTSRKSVLHHVMALAGVKNRAVVARYYLDQIFVCIVNKLDGDFRSIIDLQDEHGDTALNIAARVGNRSLVRTLLDVGANRILPNKLGLRPGDFGVENEV